MGHDPFLQDAVVLVVDDDVDLGASLARLLARSGYPAVAFETPEAALEACANVRPRCVLTDVMMGHTNGFAFAQALRGVDASAALIFMTARPITAQAVDAIRHFGGIEYLDKPIDQTRLLAAVGEGLDQSAKRVASQTRLRALTARELDVFKEITRGKSSKAVAVDLGVSQKTVEVHRAAIMTKTGAACLADLIALASAA